MARFSFESLPDSMIRVQALMTSSGADSLFSQVRHQVESSSEGSARADAASTVAAKAAHSNIRIIMTFPFEHCRASVAQWRRFFHAGVSRASGARAERAKLFAGGVPFKRARLAFIRGQPE